MKLATRPVASAGVGIGGRRSPGPGRVGGQLFHDPVVERLPLPCLLDGGDIVAQRKGDFRWISETAASVARHSAASRSMISVALAVSATFLLRASVPVVVADPQAARMAVTFWLIAEWVRCTDSASSVIVIGPL